MFFKSLVCIIRDIDGAAALAKFMFLLFLGTSAKKSLKYFAKPNYFFDVRGKRPSMILLNLIGGVMGGYF